jgi:hypothetical protein
MSGILNCVCPECGGSMGGVGREFNCQGECQTDWRQLWEQIVSAGVNQPTPKATSRVDLNGWAPKLNDRCRYPGGRCPTAVDAGLRRGRLVWPSRSDASHQSAQAFTIQETTETL